MRIRSSRSASTQLAQRAGYSPFHLQRNFKAIIGSTPKEYQTAARLRTLKQELRKDAPVSDAIYQAGFGSGSRVYEKADGQLGMTPSEYRSGGKGLTISYASGRTPLGLLMIGATDRGICFLQFGDSDRALQAELAPPVSGRGACSRCPRRTQSSSNPGWRRSIAICVGSSRGSICRWTCAARRFS